MYATKFLVVLAAAFSATALALPQGCGQSTDGVTAASIPEEPVEEPAPAKPAPEGESIASGIGGQIISGVISSIIGEAPAVIGGLLHGSGGGSNSGALQSCIQLTQACCANVQGASDDGSACQDSNVKAAFATNSACAAPGDSAVQHATDACNKVLGN
ncbi:hypothetical protein ESCO_000639 [Escovopsis weberi]|uniref:Uncharacterized protein n=1 Tax=Escovopsis weberi TaxID=150374 RepID=A0A0M8MTA5_ESCWE|nr:hypothetical protein ESCO_000639 [Escovopsis weberi]